MLTKTKSRWRNRSGSVDVTPHHYSYPSNLDEVQAEVSRVADCGERLRVAGSGTSLPPLCWTDENLLSLDHFHGIESTDLDSKRVWVRAGTRLGWLGRALAERSLGLSNWRGTSYQTLGGAANTGAHSGGLNLSCLSAQVTGLKMVLADASVKTLTPMDGEVFDAARVSLGSLGVITHVELACEPAYRLASEARAEPLDRALALLGTRNLAHRSVLMHWFPHQDRVWSQWLNKTEARAAPQAHPFFEARGQTVRRAREWLLAEAARRLPLAVPRSTTVAASVYQPPQGVMDSWDAGPPVSQLPFQQIEYGVSSKVLPEVLEEMGGVIRKLGHPALLPVQVRFAGADELWLSPCYQRSTALITVRAPRVLNATEFFAAMTDIFDRHAGRPNWAAQHDKGKDELMKLYPRFADFLALRKQYDPHGVFLNPHLSHLFGVSER